VIGGLSGLMQLFLARASQKSLHKSKRTLNWRCILVREVFHCSCLKYGRSLVDIAAGFEKANAVACQSVAQVFPLLSFPSCVKPQGRLAYSTKPGPTACAQHSPLLQEGSTGCFLQLASALCTVQVCSSEQEHAIHGFVLPKS